MKIKILILILLIFIIIYWLAFKDTVYFFINEEGICGIIVELKNIKF